MKLLQLVVLTGILVVLSIIAAELRPIAQVSQFEVGLGKGIAAWANKPAETRAERNARLQREQQELDKDAAAIWSTPWPAEKKPAKPRPATSEPSR